MNAFINFWLFPFVSIISQHIGSISDTFPQPLNKSAFSSTLLRQPRPLTQLSKPQPTRDQTTKLEYRERGAKKRELINFGRLFLFQIPMHFFEFLAQAYRRLWNLLPLQATVCGSRPNWFESLGTSLSFTIWFANLNLYWHLNPVVRETKILYLNINCYSNRK